MLENSLRWCILLVVSLYLFSVVLKQLNTLSILVGYRSKSCQLIRLRLELMGITVLCRLQGRFFVILT